MKKILTILGHPCDDSYCNALFEEYIKGAQKAGNTVKTLKLGELEFTPILKEGYKNMPELEPALVNAQQLITWADHITFVYPTWWATPPALVKSFIERVFVPGFAFKYKRRDETPFLMRKIFVAWDQFLKNKSARVIVTMDAPPWINIRIIGDPGFKMMKDICNFSGIKPVYRSYFGSVKMSMDEQRKKWLQKAYKLGLNE